VWSIRSNGPDGYLVRHFLVELLLMPRTERYISNMHEATHAVLRVSYRLKFRYIEVFRKSDERRRTQGAHGIIYIGKGDALTEQQIHASAVSFMGSLYTHLRLEPNKAETALLQGSCRRDLQEVQRAIEHLGVSIEVIKTEADVSVAKLWPVIRKVAAGLMKEWKLSYDDVLDICCCDKMLYLPNLENSRGAIL
jgi:hypothetical protein